MCKVVQTEVWGGVVHSMGSRQKIQGERKRACGERPCTKSRTSDYQHSFRRSEKQLRKTTTSENVVSVHMGVLGTPRVTQPWENKD